MEVLRHFHNGFPRESYPWSQKRQPFWADLARAELTKTKTDESPRDRRTSNCEGQLHQAMLQELCSQRRPEARRERHRAEAERNVVRNQIFVRAIPHRPVLIG